MKYLVIIGLTVVLTIGAILNLHLVIHDDGYRVMVVQKENMTFDRTFVDARDLNPISWLALPRPVRAALGKGKSEQFKKNVNESLDKVNEDLKKIFK